MSPFAAVSSDGGGRTLPDSTDIICLCNWHGIGGAQLNAGLLVAEFTRRGFDATLGFLFEREPGSMHGTDEHFVIAERAPRKPSEWSRFYSRCVDEIIGRRPHAIIGFQPTANIVAAVAGTRIPTCRVVATQRNPANRPSRVMRVLDQVIGSTTLYDINIAVSSSVQSSFDGYPTAYKSKLQVVRNATPPLTEIPEERTACRQRLGITNEKLVLGCLGRLHQQKNVTFVLDVLAALPEASLYLAGDGEEEMALRAKAHALGIASRTTFLGSLNGADVTRFYRAVDVLLFPSVYEGFGRVLVEAMSQGVPVVASDIAIVREIGGDAVARAPFDVASWVRAIRAISNDGSLAESLAHRGPVQSANFDLNAMVSGYLAAAGFAPTPSSGPTRS